jgi:hypothetical protein
VACPVAVLARKALRAGLGGRLATRLIFTLPKSPNKPKSSWVWRHPLSIDDENILMELAVPHANLNPH